MSVTEIVWQMNDYEKLGESLEYLVTVKEIIKDFPPLIRFIKFKNFLNNTKKFFKIAKCL